MTETYATKTYTVVASCPYRAEVRRYDVEAMTVDDAREQAARLYGDEPMIGVDWVDVATEIVA